MMIGPCGLLLVVSHLFAIPVSVLLVGLQKSTQLNLDVKNIFAGVTILSTAGDALMRWWLFHPLPREGNQKQFHNLQATFFPPFPKRRKILTLVTICLTISLAFRNFSSVCNSWPFLIWGNKSDLVQVTLPVPRTLFLSLSLSRV